MVTSIGNAPCEFYGYDADGNGDVSVPGDDWQQDISYLRNTVYNMVSLPKDECITDKDGQLLRYSYVNYSPYGQPAHIHRVDKYLDLQATTHIEYDPLGNIAAVILLLLSGKL